MFFIPYATDAPIYHRPIGTFLLIAVNVICFTQTGVWADTDLARSFALEFGNGMHPLEWISCHFLHYDLFHLLGNMFFLFIYGFIIEGKIGTIPFLILYFAIGWMGASLAQAMVQWNVESMFPEAGGASLVIFGLMLISLLWAPKNEVSFVGVFILFFVPRVFTFEVTVLTVGIWFFLLELFIAWLEGFSMGSGLAHVLGGVIGAGIGALMLKLDWVDCEQWDLFSLMKQDPTKKEMDYYRDERIRTREANSPELPDFSAKSSGLGTHRKLVKRLRKRMQKSNADAAIEARNNLSAMNGDEALLREEQEEYVVFLLKHQKPDEAIAELEKFVERFSEDSDRHNLKRCELLLSHRKRPSEAMHILATMETDRLDDKLLRKRQKLIDLADDMLAKGHR